jgi:hypothetical protein
MGTTRATPKKQQAKDLQAISQWVAASPTDRDKKLKESTSKIMISLARAQHGVPANVKDTSPSLVTMVVIEDQARKLETKKLDSIDHAITSINERINRIVPETREQAQLKNQYENKAKTIQLDYKIIAAKHDKFQHDLDNQLEKKNDTFKEVAETLREGREPDKDLLNSVRTNLHNLEKESQVIAKESSGFNHKIDSLKAEVSTVVQSIEEATVGPGYRPGES